MASLEQMLATILAQIEHAKSGGDELMLTGLLRRRDVICAMLGAPEQAWG